MSYFFVLGIQAFKRVEKPTIPLFEEPLQRNINHFNIPFGIVRDHRMVPLKF
jgi:hypothetical protein